MLALNQFTYLTRFTSSKNRNLFVAGLLIKFLIIFAIDSNLSTDLFFPFIEYFINSGFEDPYSKFSNLALEPFPYPAAMLYILTAPFFLLNFLVELTNNLAFVIKLPLLLFDYIIFFIINTWLRERHQYSLILLYWFSPVLIYISFIHGQLDVIPIAFLFISMNFLFKDRIIKSAIFLGIALSVKTMILITIPLFLTFLLLQKQNFLTIFKFFISCIISFLFLNLPFLFNEEFIEMVFNNSTQGQLFNAYFKISDTKIFLFPAIYLILIFRSFLLNNFSKDAFITFLGFSLGIVLIFTDVNEGWFYWLLPFLFYFQSRRESYGLIVHSLQIFYFVYFFSEVLLFEYANADLFFDLLPTFLVFIIAINCYWLYYQGFSKHIIEKIFSQPFLIGIGGDSGSGKTKLSKALADIFGSNHASIIRGDDLHKWERGNINWKKYTHLDPSANRLHDDLKSLQSLKQNKNISRKKYNHTSGRFDPASTIYSSNILIYEGLHPFFLEAQRKIMDLKIYLNPDKELLKKWKISRDFLERGKIKEDVIKQILDREQDYSQYIHSQIQHADIIIETVEQDSTQLDSTYEYKVIFTNSVNPEQLIEILLADSNLSISHYYLDQFTQAIRIGGNVEGSTIAKFFELIEDKLNKLGIVNSTSRSDLFGLITLMVVFLIFEEVNSGKGTS